MPPLMAILEAVRRAGIRRGLGGGLVAVWLGLGGGLKAGATEGGGMPVDLFAGKPVWEVQLQIAAADMQQLRTNARACVSAAVRAGRRTYPQVGIHLKGTGSFRGLDDKPGWTLDFGRFVPGGQLGGVRKIHLNNSVEDGSFLKEQIGSELFRAAGVPAPRVAHARVALNGRQLGLYVVKEGFTREFLERHFPPARGNLYDTHLGHDLGQVLRRHSGREPGDPQQPLQALAVAAAEPVAAARWPALQRTLAVDEFLSFMAMEVMLDHWDGYCLGRNNFLVYHDPSAGRLFFLPTGMDQLFGKADLDWRPGMSGSVARAVLETPEGRTLYQARFRALLGSVFNAGRISQQIGQRLAELRPFLAGAEYEAIRQEADQMRRQIVARENWLRTQLDQPEPAAVEFQANRARLTGWKVADAPASGAVQEVAHPRGKPALCIQAGPRTSASWRVAADLGPGRYRFEGEVMVAGVKPLPFGKRQGASLRLAGRPASSAGLVGDRPWQMLRADFEVGAAGEKIEFVCELRAAGGEAWFDQASLTVCRLSEP